MRTLVKLSALAVLLLFSRSVSAQVSVSINQPYYGFQVLAGSLRVINAYITNGTTNEVNWSVSGTTGGASATLSCSTSCLPVVTVTLGSTTGSCSIGGSLGSYTVTSTATVTLEAQSVDDNTKTATTTLNVCSTAVEIYVAPFYRVLYANQSADLQSWIIGNTNLGVTWAISSQPGGGNGTLSDTNKRDTVFSATVAGRYTVTATSSADNTKTASTTIYVTGNSLPSYSVTPDLTQPVDCTVDPSATGTDYEVGPARTYTTISAAMNAAFASAAAGDTIRIHNDDLTGMNPTTYSEYFQVGYNQSNGPNNGTATQPIRIVGCPDSLGNLPIVDGSNATGSSWVSTGGCAGYGIACIWPGPPTPYGYYQSGNPNPQYIVIEGIHFRHAGTAYNYTPPGGGSATAYQDGAACVRWDAGFQIVIDGNEMESCSNGTFSDFNSAHEWAGNVLVSDWEGNYIQKSGSSGDYLDHQLYLQGWLQLVQLNLVNNYTSGADGSDYKDRGLGDVIRYNFLGDEAQRQIDAVDIQDAEPYIAFEGYLGPSGAGSCAYPYCLGDTMGANILAAWQEAWHQTFIYGNSSVTSTAEYTLHFAEDHDDGMADRVGYLYFYGNTWWCETTGSCVLWDNSSGGGNSYQQFEFQQMASENNIFWAESGAGFGHPYQNYLATILANFTTNLYQSSWWSITTPIEGGSINGQTGSGWSNATNAYSFPLAVPLDPHMTGISSGNFLTTSTQPFNSTTFVPPTGSAAISAGTALSGAMALMPVRFQIRPDTGVVTARQYPLTIGALDQASAPAAGTSQLVGATLHGGTIQ